MSKIDKMTDADIEDLQARVGMYTNVEKRNGELVRENYQLKQMLVAYSKSMQNIGLSIIKMGIQMGMINGKGKNGQKS